MKEVIFEDKHRRKHFEFFNQMSYPHFQVTARVPIDPLYKYIKHNNLHFTSAIVYWLTTAAMQIKPFTWRVRGDKIIQHDHLDPSFAVLTEASEVFSFCTVEYSDNWHIFQFRSTREIEKMKSTPSFEDEDGKDNFLFMSSLPWISFTGVQHPVAMPADSVPRITWGRIENQSYERSLPLSVQAHHGLVDGQDMGKYFRLVEKMASEPRDLYEIK